MQSHQSLIGGEKWPAPAHLFLSLMSIGCNHAARLWERSPYAYTMQCQLVSCWRRSGSASSSSKMASSLEWLLRCSTSIAPAAFLHTAGASTVIALPPGLVLFVQAARPRAVLLVRCFGATGHPTRLRYKSQEGFAPPVWLSREHRGLQLRATHLSSAQPLVGISWTGSGEGSRAGWGKSASHSKLITFDYAVNSQKVQLVSGSAQPRESLRHRMLR